MNQQLNHIDTEITQLLQLKEEVGSITEEQAARVISLSRKNSIYEGYLLRAREQNRSL